MMKTRKPKYARRGFSLNELLITIIIIGILASMSLLYFGSGTDSAESVRILNELEGIQNALTTYSMENTSRNVDPLAGLDKTSALEQAERFLDRKVSDNLRDKFVYNRTGRHIEIGFEQIDTTKEMQGKLDKQATRAGLRFVKNSDKLSSVYMRLK